MMDRQRHRAAAMYDFLVALGLVFAMEGLVFAAFPSAAKRAMESVIETPEYAGCAPGMQKMASEKREDYCQWPTMPRHSSS